jgi:hypothetical protein
MTNQTINESADHWAEGDGKSRAARTAEILVTLSRCSEAN